MALARVPVATAGNSTWNLGLWFIGGRMPSFSFCVTSAGPQPMLIAMRIPVLGKCLESLALARLTWSLAIALDSGMDARRAAILAMRSAQNPYYESAFPQVSNSIRANRQFHESFVDAGVFPSDFLQQVEVAEMAGATTEALLRLAKEYDERARSSMRVLTGIATALVMMMQRSLYCSLLPLSFRLH